MCIRDRREEEFAELDEAALGEIPPTVKVAFARPIGLVKQALVAVSYTHLRAHETVLDLVCRLLLEKKKTNH